MPEHTDDPDPPFTIPPCQPTTDPGFWRMTDPCDDGCGHPIHAFGHPERRRHLIEADLAAACTERGWIA